LDIAGRTAGEEEEAVAVVVTVGEVNKIPFLSHFGTK